MLPSKFLKLRKLLVRRIRHTTGGMLGLAVALGITSGLVAVAFHDILAFAQHLILGSLSGFPPFGNGVHRLPHYLFFLVPTLGGLASGILVYSFAPGAAGAGTDALIDAFHNRGGNIPVRVTVVKFFASIFTLSTGGSAGQEGPIAQVGGGIGSLLGRLLKLPDRLKRILMLTGTAAGLGAIFHAPLGGALTAAEIVYLEDFESAGILPFVVASVVAFTVYTVIRHATGAYLQFPVFPFTHLLELLNYAVVGLVCVPMSWAFVKFYRLVRNLSQRARIPNFCKPAAGGLLVGLIAYLFPQAIGTGWNYLTDAVNGQFAFSMLLFIALAKIFTTSVTIGSGGSGGVFGPSLFIGGMTGGAVGFGLHALNPLWVVNPGSYVLVGMGAFFAGAAKAPLAGQIMVCEITGNYGLLPPLLVASTIHLVLSRKWTLYDSQRHNKFSTPVHEHALRVNVLKNIPLNTLFTPHAMQTFEAGDRLAEVFRKAARAEDDLYPVIGEDGRIAGLLTRDALREAALEPQASSLLHMEDLMTPPYFLNSAMNLHEALSVFLDSGASLLPVVNGDGQPVGFARLHDIMREYDRLVGGR